MYICKTCGKTFDAPTNFCSACGANQIEEVVAQPVNAAAPAPSVAPAPSAPGVSFFNNTTLLGSIVSFASAFIAFLAMIFTFASFDMTNQSDRSAMFALFSAVLSILGLNLIKKGEATTPLSKIGIMISFISAMAGLFFAVISMFVYLVYLL